MSPPFDLRLVFDDIDDLWIGARPVLLLAELDNASQLLASLLKVVNCDIVPELRRLHPLNNGQLLPDLAEVNAEAAHNIDNLIPQIIERARTPDEFRLGTCDKPIESPSLFLAADFDPLH